MYILVREIDNIIIGTAIRPINETIAADKGYKVYEIDESEFKPSMLGSKLQKFDKAGQ